MEEEEDTAENSSHDASENNHNNNNPYCSSTTTANDDLPLLKSALKVRTLADSLLQCNAKLLAAEEQEEDEDTTTTDAAATKKSRSEPSLQQPQQDDPTGESSSSSASSSTPPRRCVSFSTLDLHAHELVLGDNPSTAVGPPLAIGWKRLSTDTLAIDAFEAYRGERRDRAALVMPCFDRERELIGWGFSRSEMRDTQDALEKIKTSRAKNAALTLRERMAVRWRASARAVGGVGGKYPSSSLSQHR